MGLDIVFLGILLFGAYRGYRRGFAAQMIQLAGLATAFMFADRLGETLLPTSKQFLTALAAPLHLPLLYFSSLVGIWLVITFVGSVALAIYRKRVYEENKPSLGDRLFGIGTGVLVASLFVAVCIFGLERAPQPLRTWEPTQAQIQSSHAVQTAQQFRLVERALQTRQAHDFNRHLANFINYFRVKDPIVQPPTAIAGQDVPKR